MRRSSRVFVRLLLAALVLLLVVVVAGLVSLKRGIELDSIALGAVDINGLTLQLERKLSLDISELRIDAVAGGSSDTAQSKPQLDPTVVRDALRGIRWLATLFKAIDIHRIAVQDLRGSFRYREKGPGYLRLEADDTEIELNLATKDGTVLVDIESARIMGSAIQLTGSLALDTQQRQLQSRLEVVVGETLPVSLEIEADSKQLSFSGRGERLIDNLQPVVEIFDLGPSIKPWIIDYLVASEIELEALSGSIAFDDPAAILHTLYAAATVKDVAYTFAQGLEPVLAPEVQVVFDKGVLHIYPKQASFYGQDAGSTYVDIDFTSEDFYVQVYVRTKAQASGGIVTLLEYYGIPFPFRQLDGVTDTDLTVSINLRSVEITADGKFTAADTRISWGDTVFDIAALDIDLQTTRVTFNRLDLAMGDFLQGNLTGQFEATTTSGRLQLDIERFDWDNNGTHLKLLTSPAAPRKLGIDLASDELVLDIPETNWRYGERKLLLDGFSTALDMSRYAGQIPSTEFAIDGEIKTRVSGTFVAAKPAVELQFDILAIDTDKLKLVQLPASLGVVVDESVRIETPRPLHLEFQGMAINLQPSRLRIDDGHLSIIESGFDIAGVASAGVAGDIDLASGGEIVLEDLALDRGEDRGFYAQSATLQLSGLDGAPRVHSPELGLSLKVDKDGSWLLECPDLGSLHRYSPAMQALYLESGEFRVGSRPHSVMYEFSGRLQYPYPIVVENDMPTGELTFDGWFNGSTARLSVNDRLQVKIADSIELESWGIGYNLDAIINLLGDLSSQASAEQDSPAAAEPANEQDLPAVSDASQPLFRLKADNSFIWLDDKRRIVADDLLLAYGQDQLTANLRHHDGHGSMRLTNDVLQFVGSGFDHTFINQLVASLANVDSGTLQFGVNGSPETFDAVFAINDTVVKDYKHLNNMLAFINTIPGLVAFNPPDYRSDGLPAREVSVAMHYDAGVMDLGSVLIDSKELTVRGRGMIDLNANTTDMTFLLITGAKKSVTRIPILGFILEGEEEKTAVRLKVQGDLNDPQVSDTAFKELVSYPFKVIARTFTWPAHLARKNKRPATEDANEPGS